MVKKDNQVW